MTQSTLIDLNSNEYEGLKAFNTITRINEWKNLTKHILCECKCKLASRKCNSHQKWNSNKCWYECKNSKEHHVCKKYYIWNPATCTFENRNNLGTIIDDSLLLMKL